METGWRNRRAAVRLVGFKVSPLTSTFYAALLTEFYGVHTEHWQTGRAGLQLQPSEALGPFHPVQSVRPVCGWVGGCLRHLSDIVSLGRGRAVRR